MRIFSETQRFTQWWFYLIAIFVFAATCIPLLVMLSEADTYPEEALWTTGIATVVIAILFVWILFFMELRTRVDEQGVHYQFKGFHRNPRIVAWSELAEVYVRTYQPLTEYGGWGIRSGLSGTNKAYNVKGNKGLQLVFNDGKRLLIGTQEPETLKHVLDSYVSKSELYEN